MLQWHPILAKVQPHQRVQSFKETLELWNEAYENEKLSRTQVYFWYKRFKDGRKSIAYNSRSGRPLTSTTQYWTGTKITINNISEILVISYGSCQKIIGEYLNMKKLCDYFVPRNLTDKQRESRLSICKDLIETANNDSDILKTIITDDETWCFLFDPQTKKQSLEWRTPSYPRRKKVVLTSPKEK
ncbi:hypothetical protein LAZ67_14001412 [Cordylochernes scorpioides]|uniref:Mos1 transposase HTH domain-containing protein n=1 Tax=Cordylochernes scorpioides TaxID=51811 RepID=A0ABY6L6W3_9ARAC|nr:hypothetical protein LAZ67_14001412 [Cordylochernes scorpioides]